MRILRPPERITLSQWADKKRILDAKSSNEPGRWKTARLPFLAMVMDAFTSPDIEEIILVKSTQVGGTEFILNCIGYIVDQDNGPTLVLYPSDAVAEHISKNRIQPMLTSCPDLAVKFDEKGSRLLELQFPGMFVSLSGANTPSQLASKPIRFLFLDEVDKYPPRAGKEADPKKLAIERTKTFSYNRKIAMVSTPTYKSGAIWQAFQSCETQYHYYLPCPHCGQYQKLRWRQIHFDKTLPTNSQKADSARYLCQHCNAEISDSEKTDIMQVGQWRADKEGSKKRVGFHINALYSPWVRFRDVVAEFLTSKNTPETLMNFINSWLAEPFEQVSSSADTDKVLSCQGRYTRGVVPAETRIITGGVDKQRDCYYYTVRAWGPNRSSWNIDHGRVETETELLEVYNRTYHDEKGTVWLPEFVLIDSGDDTDVVYDFCYLYAPLFAPLKGSSTRIDQRFKESVIEKENSIARGMRLIRCDGHYYKDMIYSRINSKKPEYRNWYVYDGCDGDYAAQIAAEHRVEEQVGGRTIKTWKPKASGIDNHYLDCEVYAACAADVMGAFDLLVPESAPPAPPPESTKPDKPEAEESGWLEEGENWL